MNRVRHWRPILCVEYRALENLLSGHFCLFVSRFINLSSALHGSFVSLFVSICLGLTLFFTFYKYVYSTSPSPGRLRDVYNTRERFKTMCEYEPSFPLECRGGAAALTDIIRRTRILIHYICFKKVPQCGLFFSRAVEIFENFDSLEYLIKFNFDFFFYEEFSML